MNLKPILPALLLAATLVPTLAAPPEVANLRFEDGTTLGWDAAAGAAGYHVYSGDVAGLPDNGSCLVGSIPSTSTTIADDPPSGTVHFYLVSAYDADDEGTLGTDSDAILRSAATACIPARRAFTLTPNGVAADGARDGVAPRRNASAQAWSSRRETTGVYRHTGEFFLTAVDSTLPGRGLDWVFRREYRSQIDYDGPLGHGWDFSANLRLAALGSDVLFHDGSGRREVFERIDATHFTSPKGLYAVLFEKGDGSFKLRWPDGRIARFHALDATHVEGAIERFEDSVGNEQVYLYDHQGLLRTVVTSLGHAVEFDYDAAGRLIEVADFAGRTFAYGYDGLGNLTSVRTPTVNGTPNGNDFPAGKTTSYGYSDGFGDPQLNHNLLTVKAPNEQGGGPELMANVYGTTPGTLERDRVETQTIGGTNASGVPAGGTLSYAYTHVNPGAMPDLTTPRRLVTVTDRNGNQSDYTHNFAGHLIEKIARTNRNLRPAEGDYTTTFAFNADGEVTEVTWPEGNRRLFTYDTPGADRYREGNLLELRQVADAFGGGGRGDGHGAEVADLVWSFTYEPIFNRRETAVDPRGNDPAYVPQNGGTQSAMRYTTTWEYDHQEDGFALNGLDAYIGEFEIDDTGATQALGDRNGDGRTDQIMGNVVRRTDPPVTLDPASNQAAIEGDTSQEAITRIQWNDFGQMTAQIDAELNRHDYTYHPEDDPDGDGNPSAAPADGRTLDGTTGGWLRSRMLDSTADPDRDNKTDPAPTMIEESFAYDDVGNQTHVTDGRGVLTRRIYNELNEVIELRRAAATADASGPDGDPSTGRGETGLTAFGFKTRFAYDANGNVERVETEDRGLDRGVGSFFEVDYVFDLVDRPVETMAEVAAGNALSTRHRYDPNQNLVLTILPEGNAESFLYDERDLWYQTTRGAVGPPPLALLSAGDPINYDVRGGTPSTRTYDYDGNGGEVETIDGRGHPWQRGYDGHDRWVRTIDPLGNRMERCLDPTGLLVRLVLREPGGGLPSACTSTSANDLVHTEMRYDERHRRFGVDRRLFVTGTPHRVPVVDEGTLDPGDGFVNRLLEFDRLGRPTFATHDSGAAVAFDWDGVSRPMKRLEADGQSTVEWSYDAAHNLIERVETEVSSSPGPPPEEFLTTFFHDALGRPTQTVDNIGRSWRRTYDSLGALVAVSDPRGPNQGSSINRRSPGRTGIVVPINDDGNVTYRTHDGLGRRTTLEKVLTPSGEGDGTLAPTPDLSNAHNPDGLITLTTTWDDNSLEQSIEDDGGNVTSYGYDNLNRRTVLTAPDGTQSLLGYDEEDNPAQTTDANGSVLDRTFDLAGRLTRIDVTPAAGTVGTTLRTYGWDGAHRLVTATDNNDPGDPDDDVTIERFYDSLSRVVEETQTIGTRPAGALVYTDFQWEAADRMTQLVYPDGRAVDYDYDAADRLTTVADTVRAESAAFDYFGLRRPHTITRNNGVTTTMLDASGTTDIGFDEARRIIRLQHLDALDTDLATFEYGHDAMDNVLFERRAHDPVGMDLMGEVRSYDSANRMIAYDEGPVDPMGAITGMPNDSADWTLDGASNWAEVVHNGTTYGSTSNNLNQYDELQPAADDGLLDDFRDDVATMQADGRNQDHDANGNLTLTDDGTADYVLAYNAFNRRVNVERDGMQIGTYLYDALGRRVHREVTNRGGLNQIRRYLHNPLAVEERDGAGVTVRQTIGVTRARLGTDPGYGNNRYPLWQVRGADADHLLLDLQLSTIGATPGASDTIVERVTYSPFGGPTFENATNTKLCNPASPTPCPAAPPGSPYIASSTIGNPELWHGMRYDPEFGDRTRDPGTDWFGAYGENGPVWDPNAGRHQSRSARSGWGAGSALGNPYATTRVEPTDWDDHLNLLLPIPIEPPDDRDLSGPIGTGRIGSSGIDGVVRSGGSNVGIMMDGQYQIASPGRAGIMMDGEYHIVSPGRVGIMMDGEYQIASSGGVGIMMDGQYHIVDDRHDRTPTTGVMQPINDWDDSPLRISSSGIDGVGPGSSGADASSDTECLTCDYEPPGELIFVYDYRDNGAAPGPDPTGGAGSMGEGWGIADVIKGILKAIKKDDDDDGYWDSPDDDDDCAWDDPNCNR